MSYTVPESLRNIFISAGKQIQERLTFCFLLIRKLSGTKQVRDYSRYTLVFLSVLFFFLYLVPLLQASVFLTIKPGTKLEKANTEASKFDSYSRKLKGEIAGVENRLRQRIPASPYLVVNTTANQFRLYRNRQVFREGLCSTGSYIMLQAHNKQQWIFKTPKGMFRVQGKTTFPVWHKPDWAFIEEGLPVPPPGHYTRYEAGVLGEYALSIGDGYLIHGTLYKRLLGMPVTHGCIRMNDEDLSAVYRNLVTGSKVFIY